MANSEEDEANKNEVSQTNTSFLLKMEEVEESGNGSGSGNEIKIRLPSDDELKEADVSIKNRYEVLTSTLDGITLHKDDGYKTLIRKNEFIAYLDYQNTFKIDNFTIYEYLYKLYAELGKQCLDCIENKFRFTRIIPNTIYYVNNTFQILSVETLRSEDILNMDERSFWMISLGKLLLYELRRFLTGNAVDEETDKPSESMMDDYAEELNLIKGTPLFYGLVNCMQPELSNRRYINI